jgi:cardiolipin synthase
MCAASRWNSKRKYWTIAMTVLITVIGVSLAMNFAVPEKRLEHKVEHKYAISDAVSPGNGELLGGNPVRQSRHGPGEWRRDFPRCSRRSPAQHTITFETYITGPERSAAFADALCDPSRPASIWRSRSIPSEVGYLRAPQMRAAGGAVELYRPLRWCAVSRLNNRTRRLLVMGGNAEVHRRSGHRRAPWGQPDRTTGATPLPH